MIRRHGLYWLPLVAGAALFAAPVLAADDAAAERPERGGADARAGVDAKTGADAETGADAKTGVDAWSRGDYSTAVRVWEPLAARGDADAQFNLGQAHKLGRGVPQDLKQAEMLFGKAAAQGHVQASDNYGLLLFDRGERVMAMPYVKAAAGRGDPRAEYLLGIAHFNGDIVARDWVRAYALMSLARGAGLPQALPALTQMDSFIPLDQRQQAAGLAQQLAAEADATRSRQYAAADLGNRVATPAVAATQPVAPATVLQPRPDQAVAAASRTANGASPRDAGADYARPSVTAAPVTPQVAAHPIAPPVAARPVAPPAPPVAVSPRVPSPPARVVPATPTPAPRPVQAAAPVSAPAASGTWRIQLGAFGVAANADSLWTKVRARPELSGHPRISVPLGAVVKLQAGGFTQESAQSACASLTASGLTCIVVRN